MTAPALAIRARGLGKEYAVAAPGPRYRTLREAVQSLALAPFRRAGAALRGDPGAPAARRFWALKDVSFDVRPGEVVGIIGRNGAGKSTLLKVLSRITEPTEGRAELLGRVGSLLEVGTGFHPELDGADNIYLSGAILGMSRAEIRARFEEIVAFAEVRDFLGMPLKHYSSGMYMRLAFAVAAHLDPEVLLIDEVLAVGDAAFQKKCLGKMTDVARAGRTVLFVSHNMAAVQALCERAVLLDAGRVLVDASAREAVARYMELGAAGAAEVRYEPDATKDAQVREVRLLDHEGRPSAQLDMLRPFTIEVVYEVRRRLTAIVVGANIFTSLNESLIATCDHDLDRSRLGAREPGLHATRVQIPGRLLNSGIFSLVIGISVPGKAIYDRREALQFELFDSGSFVASGGGEVRRNALLLLELPWEQRPEVR